MASVEINSATWTEESLVTEIERLTVEKWRADSYPLFLSELGVELRKSRGSYHGVIAPLKLRQFIATRLSSAVVVITHPRQSQKIALLPAGETFSFLDPSTTSSSARSTSERIQPSVWAAFVKPIAPSCRRYINLDELKFHDLPEGNKPNFPNYKVVSEQLIVDGRSAEYDADKVAEIIRLWASENGISEDQLRNRSQSGVRSARSFFDTFKGLSEGDLRRIEIPFDIVMKLANR